MGLSIGGPSLEEMRAGPLGANYERVHVARAATHPAGPRARSWEEFEVALRKHAQQKEINACPP